MLKRIAIIVGSVVLGIAVIGALYFYLTGGPNPQAASDLLDKTTYLAKSKESYARCYNSINYGTSLIGDIRLKILSENFYDKSINSDRLDTVEKSFMDTVKAKCQKTVYDYQQAYDKAIGDQEEMHSSTNAIWNFLFGSANGQPTPQELNSFAPARARMSIAFNDYIFTEQEVKEYFNQQLGL
jgi:hypothetical protein